jgi:hypothetical protein
MDNVSRWWIAYRKKLPGFAFVIWISDLMANCFVKVLFLLGSMFVIPALLLVNCVEFWQTDRRRGELSFENHRNSFSNFLFETKPACLQFLGICLCPLIYFHCNMFHLSCINQIHNIQITNKMHFNTLWCILITLFSPTYFGRYCDHLQGEIITGVLR